MDNTSFWNKINEIIKADFSNAGLAILDKFAEQLINGRIVYQRFSPTEQYGSSEGGATQVIASIIAGAETLSDPEYPFRQNFKKNTFDKSIKIRV